MKFDIIGLDPKTNNTYKMVYDNQTSAIFQGDGITPFSVNTIPSKTDDGNKLSTFPKYVSPEAPGFKTSSIKILKIQLGLSCNYGCEYCSQRFVPNTEFSNPYLINSFVKNLDNWLTDEPKIIEFWGGEPLVYWKTLKPLTEALAEKFAKTKFQMVTNASLLTDEIVEWLDHMEFSIGLSHDGPGMNVRGEDIFLDPEKKRIIFKLIDRLKKHGRISFNAMMHRENHDRAAIQKYFDKLFEGTEHSDYIIGEGGFIDVYDEGGFKNSFEHAWEYAAFRTLSFKQLRNNEVSKFDVNKRMIELIVSFSNHRNADTLGQKCGMDKEDTIAVDLLGNILTCQNVTAEAVAPNGRSHKIGHVNRIKEAKLDTSTHWKFRKSCQACPVLQSCKGSCMFLEGRYFDKSCDNAYSDHLPFFAAAFEYATGLIPVNIQAEDGSLPLERQVLWTDESLISKLPKTRETPRRKNDEN